MPTPSGIWLPGDEIPGDDIEIDDLPNAGPWARHDNGLVLPSYLPLKPRRVTGLDVFAGAGGMSLGMMQAGVTILAGIEWDAAATVTYLHNLGAYPVQLHFATPEDEQRLEKFLERMYETAQKNGRSKRAPRGKRTRSEPVATPYVSGANFPAMQLGVEPVAHFFFGDMRKFSGAQILEALDLERGELDIVAGGPPCQGFSRAGKQNVMDPRNSMVFEFARLVLDLNPKTVVMENVPGIVSMVTPEGVNVVDAFCRILEDGGFAGFNALKNSLLASSGAGAFVRGKVRTKNRALDDDEEHEPQLAEIRQEPLFTLEPQ